MADYKKEASFDQLPQRAKKFARTKVGLLHALVERLDQRPLEDISIRELCDAAQISEASFFNYFPKKQDMLLYFVELWSIEAFAHAQKALSAHGALAAIEAVFALTAQAVTEHPAVMAEVIVHQARLAKPPELTGVSLAERLFALPDLEGIEELEPRGLDAILPKLLEEAVRRGELPQEIDRGMAFLALSAIFFGVPLLLRRSAPEQVGAAFKAQLSILWAGLTAQLSTQQPKRAKSAERSGAAVPARKVGAVGPLQKPRSSKTERPEPKPLKSSKRKETL